MVVKYIVTQALKATVKKAGRKTLTADKGALRISEINKKIRNLPRNARQDILEDHIDEVKAIYDKKDKKHLLKDYK